MLFTFSLWEELKKKKKKDSEFQQHCSGLPGTQNSNEFQHDLNTPAWSAKGRGAHTQCSFCINCQKMVNPFYQKEGKRGDVYLSKKTVLSKWFFYWQHSSSPSVKEQAGSQMQRQGYCWLVGKGKYLSSEPEPAPTLLTCSDRGTHRSHFPVSQSIPSAVGWVRAPSTSTSWSQKPVNVILHGRRGSVDVIMTLEMKRLFWIIQLYIWHTLDMITEVYKRNRRNQGQKEEETGARSLVRVRHSEDRGRGRKLRNKGGFQRLEKAGEHPL